MWLQITSNTGPVECCVGVGRVLKVIEREARENGIQLELLDAVPGERPGSFKSVILGIKDAEQAHVQAFIATWTGTVKWVWESPYRAAGARKNWFIGVDGFEPAAPIAESEIRYEPTTSSGPGGQHVNKTQSAVRATHLTSGISVKVQTERSQHANKRLAAQLISRKLAQRSAEALGRARASFRDAHRQAERGNAIRTFVGEKFVEKRG